LVARQKSGPQDSADSDIHHVDLSDVKITEGLDAVTIAMSRLAGLSFATGNGLQGATWIGNEVQGRSFLGTPMNKSEMLDCTFEECLLQNTALFRSDWSGSVFTRCTLEKLDLPSTCLINTSFNDCTFIDVRLGPGTTLNGPLTLGFNPQGDLVED